MFPPNHLQRVNKIKITKVKKNLVFPQLRVYTFGAYNPSIKR